MNPATWRFSIGSLIWSRKCRTDRTKKSSPSGNTADNVRARVGTLHWMVGYPAAVGDGWVTARHRRWGRAERGWRRMRPASVLGPAISKADERVTARCRRRRMSAGSAAIAVTLGVL